MNTALSVIRDEVNQLAKTETDFVNASEALLMIAKNAIENDPIIEGLTDLRAQAIAIGVYLTKKIQSREARLEAGNNITESRLRIERAIGSLIKKMQDAGEIATNGRPPKRLQDTTFSETVSEPMYLADVGVSKDQSHRWKTMATLPEDQFEEAVNDAKENGWELTSYDILQRAKNAPHVSHNSGVNEWYTPPEYIEAALTVLGTIDLDPASSEIANQTVNAKTFYSVDNSGLDFDWQGRVWMNPPYASDLIGRFTAKFARHAQQGDITAGIVLVNNATETVWFSDLVSVASAAVFIKGRIKFLNTDGEAVGAPLQGQALIYFGDDVELFLDTFKQFGWGATL